MDWLTFTSNTTGALAWPIAAVAIVLIFRKQMAGLITRVTRVSTPLGSIDAEAREALIEAEGLQAQIKSAAGEGVDEDVPGPTDVTPDSRASAPSLPTTSEISTRMDQALNLVDIDRATSVRVAWEIFEEYTGKIAKAAPTTTPWKWGAPLVVNLSGYGLPTSALLVVKTLRDIHERVVVYDEPVSHEAAENFCNAARQLLFNLTDIAKARLDLLMTGPKSQGAL